MRQTTGTRKSPGEKIVKDIKRATRKQYSSIPKQNSAQLQGNLTNALARPCNIKPQQRSSLSVLRRPVEIAAHNANHPSPSA